MAVLFAAGAVLSPPAAAELVIDLGTASNPFAAWTADKLTSDIVFAKYGQNAWASVGSSGFDTGPQFTGVTFNENKAVGGVTETCVDYVGCAYFGAEARAKGSGALGATYRIAFGGGTLDIRYPVSVTLDLPYGSNGTGVPTVGGEFTIGSSWSVSPGIVVSLPGSPPMNLTPLLASTGPGLQAAFDLVGNFEGSARGRICVVDCLAAGPSIAADIASVVPSPLAAINLNNDGKVRVLGNEVSAAQPGEALNGILKYYIDYPTLDAEGGLSADQKTLKASTEDKLAGIGVGLDEIVSQLIGLPLSGSFGINFAGKFLGIGYNIVDAAFWLNALLKQAVSFVGTPIIDLLFSSDVQVKKADGTFGAPTKTVSFEAGDSIVLKNSGAQLLGVAPSYRLAGTATNEIDLPLQGEVNVKALGLTTPLGDIGPLVDESVKFDVGSIDLDTQTFPVAFDKVDGGFFNMLFNPGSAPNNAKLALLPFWDTSQWSADCGYVLSTCSLLPQTKVLRLYQFDPNDDNDTALFDCLAGLLADGCTAEQAARWIDPGHFVPDFSLSTSSRLPGRGGLSDVFFGDLVALNDPDLAIQPDITPEEIDRGIAALRSAFGPQPFVVPPFPTPEPGAWALLSSALMGMAVAGRRKRASVPV